MTVAQCPESAHRSRSSASRLHLENEHDAPDETATMSSYGPPEDPYVATSIEELLGAFDLRNPTRPSRHAETQTQESYSPVRIPSTRSYATQTGKQRAHRDVPRDVQFAEFAEQLRQQRYFEDRKRLLKDRKRVLQKTITLSARLHRVSSWIRDGLVEISRHSDAICFVRVHQHMQNLIDLSYSQWNHELHALDPLERGSGSALDAAGSSDVLAKLSSSAQADLLDLLSYVRSNPRFLVERFRVLAHPQIVSLTTSPRFEGVHESELGPIPHTRKRRLQAYSKQLEDYSTSFERSNPLSFLLFNMYGTNQSSVDSENQLRLSTWSTVCAELMTTSDGAHHALLPQLLNAFASLYEWRARDSVEMFLMDILQRGAFILDLIGDNYTRYGHNNYDPLSTTQAQEFFDNAIRDLFAIFVRYDGGFPTGALQFVSAVLKKLPSVEQQMRIRGEFFSGWFLNTFLRLAITYPENEDMLLKFHISDRARQYILYELWFRAITRINDIYNERSPNPVDPDFRYYVEVMVGTIGECEVENPYSSSKKSHEIDLDDSAEASITVCVSEIVQVLEALSPQAIHGTGAYDTVVSSSMSIFHATHSRDSGRFNRLRADLITLLEPGSSTSEAHPCQEQWLQLEIDATGRPRPPQHSSVCPGSPGGPNTRKLDAAQAGALRLFTDQASDTPSISGISYRTDLLESSSLETLFRRMADHTKARLDPLDCNYWEDAADVLRDKYPLSILVKNDSAVLRPVFLNSRAAQDKCKECCARLEIQLSTMEDTCTRIRQAINTIAERFENLRLKIWYSADVVLSKHYDDAKNIAKALNNMAVSLVQSGRSGASPSLRSGRPFSPRSSRSTTSSMFEQPYEDIMNIMKASSEHGGPKKLADKQIELTESWLKRNNIDNFCKGEERIHRFCMEVHTVSRNLVGETLSEAPVLWASELFARERGLYDVRAFSVTSAPASTRSPSFISETTPTTYTSPRPWSRSINSLKMAIPDDRRSNSSSKIYKGLLPPELASSIGSPGRAYSATATTTDSISSVFSNFPSNARSLTAPSVYSRSASIHNDPGLSRFTDTAFEKTRFLEKVQQILVCLLLSDLGCPVWSLGSETDAMLDTARNTAAVDSKLRQRVMVETLVDDKTPAGHSSMGQANRSRSQSVFGRLSGEHSHWDQHVGRRDEDADQFRGTPDDAHLDSLSELLRKLSQQVDPIEKLTVVEEFHKLSLSRFGRDHLTVENPSAVPSLSRKALRRSSLDSRSLQLHEKPRRAKTHDNSVGLTEDEITKRLKSVLAKLRPKTLFRDLQYISAFVPAELTEKTPRGKALLHLGLAALAYKNEVCHSMVDVADRMLPQGDALSASSQATSKIVEFWMSAAREDNAVAQRQLASLYLSRPELLPIMSLPLSKSSKIFNKELSWNDQGGGQGNTQALCLALHWMQQAEKNGDRLAQQKVKEISIR